MTDNPAQPNTPSPQNAPAGHEAVPHTAGLFRDLPQDAEDSRIVPQAAEFNREVPQAAEPFREMPQSAAPHRSVPQAAEVYREMPQGAEPFREIPQAAEFYRAAPHQAEAFREIPRSPEGELSPTRGTGPESRDLREALNLERHVLTVREAMRLFEQAGVPRCERSISGWCRPNKHGERRLDAHFDEAERRYRITGESVARVIAEEQAKDGGKGSFIPFEPVEAPVASPAKGPEKSPEIEEMKDELLNLRIDNRAKEQVIAQMAREREMMLERSADASHRIGSLETELRLLGGGRERREG